MSIVWIQLGEYRYYLEQVGSWQPQGFMYMTYHTREGHFVDENGYCVDTVSADGYCLRSPFMIYNRRSLS